MKTSLAISIAAIIAASCLSGCLHFADSADVNLPMDQYFAGRNFILSGENAFAQDLSGLVGRIAYKDAKGKYQFMNVPLLKNGKKPQVRAVQSAYAYSSKIDRGFSTSVTLALLSPDASGKTAASFEIRDVATATIDVEGEPTRSEFAAAASVAGAPVDRPWYWVRAVTLADLRRQYSVNINGKTTVTGTGFSANGVIYNNPSAAEWVPLVAIDPVPMNALADGEVTVVSVDKSFDGAEGQTTRYVINRAANEVILPAEIR